MSKYLVETERLHYLRKENWALEDRGYKKLLKAMVNPVLEAYWPCCCLKEMSEWELIATGGEKKWVHIFCDMCQRIKRNRKAHLKDKAGV